MGQPSPDLPPLSAVRAFEAAARLGSFTRAAEELYLTQAAVSYQIKRLEQRLGLLLFRRLPRQVALTPAGERLAAVVLEAFKAMRVGFAQAVERSETRLAITALPTIASNWLVPRLGAFQLAHPKLAVRLDTTDTLVDLHQGEFDLGIRIGLGDWPGLGADFLMPSTFTPLCSPTLRERLQQPADLLRLPRHGRPRWWRQWLSEAGVADPDLSAESGVELGIEQYEVTAAIAGHGVAITSPHLFREEIAAGRLLQPFEHVCRDQRDYWLVYASARSGSASIQAFRRWLLQEARTEAEKPISHGSAANRI